MRAAEGAAFDMTDVKSAREASMSITLGRREALHPAAEPNVIPFIDVLLVLLIIFMVTAPKPTVDLQLQLPARSAGPPLMIAPTIVDLRATPNGYGAFIGDEEIALTHLPSAVLAYAMAGDPALREGDVFAEARVYVRAVDQGVAYGVVVAALDELKSAGFEQVGVFSQEAA